MPDKNPTSKDLIKYQGNYSEEEFWKKLKKFAAKAGAKEKLFTWFPKAGASDMGDLA